MKNKIFGSALVKIIMVAVLLLPTISVCHALPDLQVWELEYSKTSGRLVANIYNQAEDPAIGGFSTKFYDNNNLIGEYFYNEKLLRYSIVSAYIKYDLSEDEHNFKAVVDPENRITESIENNNEKLLSVENVINKTPVNAYPVISAGAEKADKIYFYIIAVILLIIVIVILLRTASHSKKNIRNDFLSLGAS